MAEEDQVLDKMEHHTYKILKEQNEKQQKEIDDNKIKIYELQNDLVQIQQQKENCVQVLISQEQEMKNLQDEITVIKSRNDTEIFALQKQLRGNQQIYSEQEKKNEIVLSLQEFRQPNLYFCDIEKNQDGSIFVKVVFKQDFNIEILDAKYEGNTFNFVAYLQNNEVSHIVKHNVQIAQQKMVCQGTVLQKNEITFKFGLAT